MNPRQPRAPHMMVSGDTVVFCDDGPAPFGLDYRATGFSARKRELSGDVEFHDLRGRTVIPGLVDAHIHIVWWAFNLKRVDLAPARSEEGALEILKAGAKGLKPGEWLIGHGWTHNLWEKRTLPTRWSLDSLFPETPVALSSKCGHLQWVNTVAVARAGITGSTPDPHGGEIEKVNRNGVLEPTGILKETAGELLDTVIVPPSDSTRREAVVEATAYAHSLGITGMHTPEPIEYYEDLQVLHGDGRLGLRINFLIPVAFLDDLADLRIRHGVGDEMLRIAGVKLFSDGSLGGRTALMYDPYENEPTNYGICVTEAEEIAEKTLKANRLGLAMAIHAIGDKAIGNVLSAYERSALELGASGGAGTNPFVRNRIEHLQVVSPQDWDRIRKLKPVASMQPVHLCADMGPADSYWGARSRYAYAIKTAMDAGCPLAFGSDAPVEPVNPFYGLYAAVTRQDLERKPAQGWYPEERISVEDALAAYTTGPALASGQPTRVGDLSAGKLADFVVLNEDPLSVPPGDLKDMKPSATYLGGQMVYQDQTGE
ncbi:MAG: amidohydrolase [Candidatus Sumerlaeaceae bacterium]|nr:amidohydrolase [Candidatus Sumerlaeaceae bacterium]